MCFTRHHVPPVQPRCGRRQGVPPCQGRVTVQGGARPRPSTRLFTDVGLASACWLLCCCFLTHLLRPAARPTPVRRRPPRGSPGAGTGAASYLTCPQVLAPHLSWERSQQPLPGPPFSCPFLVLMRDTLSSGLLNGRAPQGFVLGHIPGLQTPTLGDDPADRPPRPDAEPPSCRPRAAGLQS